MRTERQCRAPQWSGSGAERGGCAEDQQARESSPQRWHSCVQMASLLPARRARRARARGARGTRIRLSVRKVSQQQLELPLPKPRTDHGQLRVAEPVPFPTAQSLLVPQLCGILRMRNGNVASETPPLFILASTFERAASRVRAPPPQCGDTHTQKTTCKTHASAGCPPA